MLRWVSHLKAGPKRFRHAAVAVGHRVYSFGGYCGRETYMYNMGQIDVHVFNTVSFHWMKLPPVTKGEHPLEVPYMRWGHTAVLLEDILIWGGFTYTRKYCNVLYAFDVDTHRWFTPEISGTVPGARCGHSACVLGKAMYVFGGFNWQTRCTNDIHKLDATTMVWSLINTRGTPAPGSSCHSATIIGTKMFVFGGQGDQFDYNNNISVFDTVNSSWMITPYAQVLPEGRRGHSAFAFNGELYIFGGHKFLLDWTFNDLWKFNPETLYWKKVEPKGKGLCSWMFWMCCCCMIGDRIILFGEYTQPPDVQVYILDLSPSLKTLCKLTVMQYGLEQSGLPHDIRWELTAMTTYSNRRNNSPPKTC